VTAEPRKDLSQLAADRTGADDQEPIRQLGQIEYGLVGEIARIRESRDVRDRGPRARRDHGTCEFESRAVDFDGAATDERRGAEMDVDAERPESLDAVVHGELRAHRAHPLHRLRKRDARSRRVNQRFRRHAPDIQTIATHLVALDERHARAEAGGDGRGHEAASARADDDQMVARFR